MAGGGCGSPFLSCAILRAALHAPPPVSAPVWGTLLAVAGGTPQGGRLGPGPGSAQPLGSPVSAVDAFLSRELCLCPGECLPLALTRSCLKLPTRHLACVSVMM